MPKADQSGDTAELLGTLFPGIATAQKAEAAKLLERLADDWKRESRGQTDPAAVRVFQEKDLAAALGTSTGSDRLETLHAFLLQRLAEQLGRRTFALGKEIASGATKDPQAKTRGAALLKEVEHLAAEVKTLKSAPPALRQELGEAMMEALYAVERKGMSMRLQRESS